MQSPVRHGNNAPAFKPHVAVEHQVLVHYVRIIGEKQRAVTGVCIPALGIYKPSVIFGKLQHTVLPALTCSRLCSASCRRATTIHKNQLARVMFEGTQKALAELQQNQAEGGARGQVLRVCDMSPSSTRMIPWTALEIAPLTQTRV
jgi:hypothetical protein